MMEAARTSERLVNFYQTATTQKTAIFEIGRDDREVQEARER
jgi:hypothetical protein